MLTRPDQSKNLVQLDFDLSSGASDLEELEAALFAAGALSVTLEDAADHPILEPPPGATPLWPDVRVKALFESGCDRERIRTLLQEQLGPAAPDGSFESIADRAWEREWLKDFKPMRFGRRLWICPGGMRPPPAAQAEAVEIQLDPGLAFGTGTHPTTALCLEWLDGQPLQGKALIDYGCGSGILAVAALKLGARHAVGVDIDPQALTASLANARRNGVEDRLRLRAAPGEPHAHTHPHSQSDVEFEPADILVANILAAPLEELARKFASLVEPGGHLVLSGLLEPQATAVASRYTAWFDMHPPAARDQWIRLTGIRRNEPNP